MSHLNDLATQLAEAEDAFAAGDVKAGERATLLASTLAHDASRAATRLALAVNREKLAAFEAERAR